MNSLGQFVVAEDSLVFETEFPEGSGFFLKIKYLPPDEARRISQEKAARLMVKGGKVVGLEEESVEAELARLVVSWRGLTPKVLSTLVAGLKTAELEETLAKNGMAEVPCTDENKLFLLKKAWGLRGHIDVSATMVSNYQVEKLEEEIKN